jgi:hypothetical protein
METTLTTIELAIPRMAIIRTHILLIGASHLSDCIQSAIACRMDHRTVGRLEDIHRHFIMNHPVVTAHHLFTMDRLHLQQANHPK